MKEVKIYDQEKYDWALDSALKALSREDKKAFMNRIWDMSVVSNISQTDILYMFIHVCSKCLFNQPAIKFYFWRT